MKKYLFIINNMHIGGTRSSLLNLLHMLPDSIEVTLYLLSDHGSYKNMIPKDIQQIPTTWVSNAIYSRIDELSIAGKLCRAIIKCLRKIFGEEKILTFVNRMIANKIKRSNSMFDVAIGYSEGEPINLAACIYARKKYGWIHNDYSNLIGVKAGFYKSLDEMDKLFFVAITAKMDFEKYLPQYKNKLAVIRNTINSEGIMNKAMVTTESFHYSNKKINIVSVGRLSKQKAFDRIPQIASALKNKYAFCWYIIGGGDEYDVIKREIEKNNVGENVILMGAKSNPYPLIKNADVMVVTSIYESQPMVMLEALTLGVPVISTQFTSAFEILENKPYGILCDNSVEGIADALNNNLNSKALTGLREGCKAFCYNNAEIISKVLGL